MSYDPELAEMRFGCGLSPVIPPAQTASDLLRTLDAPDDIARRFPIETFQTFRNRLKYQAQLGKLMKQTKGQAEKNEVKIAQQTLRRRAYQDSVGWLAAGMMRRVHSRAPFRERLTQFWADHFTAVGKGGVLKAAMPAYVETAIRPHVAARFETLLIEAVTHPLMVHYLDQNNSFGPNSVRAKRNKATGLNENLGREILELHTLGVGGPYTQTDVTELAKLLTGLTFNPSEGRIFRPAMAEPGAETVLGKRYGGRAPALEDIHAVLTDLARHPVTAAHICGKLATHFVGDTPPPALVAAMTDRYIETGGALRQVYAAMLHHPEALSGPGNIKQPMDLIGSAMRALAVEEARFKGAKPNQINNMIRLPLRLMGHEWGNPPGPNGIPEADQNWISPQGIAARLRWTMSVPNMLVQNMPDPRSFVHTALGSHAPASVKFVAEAAESRWEGVGLVLASPAFQKM